MSNKPGMNYTKISRYRWTHPSVLALAGEGDPVEAITERAREVVFGALQLGWSGPPYDPFTLAELLKISIEPNDEVREARTCAEAGRFRIEFNPNRPTARINYSIAHEIAHTLFPDCAHEVRNRYTHSEMKQSDWQLEALCNIAAAEILMPLGSLKTDQARTTDINEVVSLRRQFGVSSEAIILRITKLANTKSFAFAARRDETSASGRYKIDYCVPSRNWVPGIRTGFAIPEQSVVSECTAIGFTSSAEEAWQESEGKWKVQCLGIPPYPGHNFPRVVGIVSSPDNTETTTNSMKYLKGDASQPRGKDPAIIVQIVNDKAITWGRGFAASIRTQWPSAQRAFTEWAFNKRAQFKLGNVHFGSANERITIASLIAQHGYGPSSTPRLRYSALEDCLMKVAEFAKSHQASVHMPRVGTGEAGGHWEIVSELIDETLSKNGIHVTVYDLPRKGEPITKTGLLFQSAGGTN